MRLPGGAGRVGPSLNDFVCSQQERLRDRQAKRLRGLEIDDELELGGLLDWNVCWLSAF
jgi:hypothetical protein